MDIERLGPYKVGRRLGKGGMGTVFAGVDENTRQEVAIKVLSAALAAEEGFRERFTSEIETLRKLRHPNIVRLYGFGQQDGHLFYSMELVPGVSLEEELTQGRRFEWKEVLTLAVQICRALKHAHDHGVIHRDIKPANVMLTPDGQVKLSDFGIAKLFGNTGLTSEGGVLGTAEYMAPEQADGRPVTHKADLYSLGGLMYALLAGRPPFRARTLPEMLQLQRFAQADPVRRYAPQTPEEIEELLTELLEKEPDNRPTNAMVLIRRLEAMYHGLVAREKRLSERRPLVAEDLEFTVSPEVDLNRTGSVDSTLAGNEAAESVDPLSATIGATASPQAELPDDDTGYSLAIDLAPATNRPLSEQATMGASQVNPPPAPPHESKTKAPEPAAKFKRVEEVDQDAEDGGQSYVWLAQIGLLAVSLIAVVAVGWYLTRPVSAEALYAEINAAAIDGRPERLAEVAEQLDEFLKRFPQDARATEVGDLKQQLELDRQQRRFERQARRGTGQSLTPIERAYVEAMQLATQDPQRAADKLAALLTLFSQEHAATSEMASCLELARQQLARLQAEGQADNAAQLQVIEAQLRRAEELAVADLPAARAVWNAIVVLYGDKLWAVAATGIARRALEEHPANVSAAASEMPAAGAGK
ncbi:MAG: serine/threonine protein kinase [Pirellulales bacterium]|nr:serine/threonine protein kinase [Pirellulales bacterium]